MKLLLVRHGETTSNVARALDTAHPGADLTDLGRQQAEGLALGVGSLAIDAIWASPRARALQTAAPLASARGLAVNQHAGLSEISAGDVEMKTDEDSRDIYNHVVLSWALGDRDVRMPGAESGHEFLSRFDEAIATIAQTGVESAVVVCHAAAILIWTGARTDTSGIAGGVRPPIANTGGVEIKGEPGDWTAIDWHPAAISILQH